MMHMMDKGISYILFNCVCVLKLDRVLCITWISLFTFVFIFQYLGARFNNVAVRLVGAIVFCTSMV